MYPLFRRALYVKFVTFFLLFLGGGTAVYSQQTYLDNFNTFSYSNNNGTSNFSANWVETNEITNPSNGRIRINSNQLRFQNLDSRYITRTLDLSGAVSATLTLDYNRTSGNESVLVQLFDGGGYNTVAVLAGTGSVNYTLTALEISSTSAIRFRSGSGNWGNGETLFVDNVQFLATYNPSITIDNVTVNEDDGTATFTATHVGVNTSGPFAVNFTTNDGTAAAGMDYAATAGTLSFNGTVGDTEQITIAIIDDTIYEISENFVITLNTSTDPTVDISDSATATIDDNEVILNNTDLVLVEEFDGYMGYTSTGGSLRTQDNNTNACSITTTSSNTLTAPIPLGATINKAFLYWAHSNASPDSQVTFEGNTVNADVMYTTSIGFGRVFYGGVSDVTSIVSGIANPNTNTYDFTDLTIDNSTTYCNSATVLGGWSLIIFYTDINLPASTINVYQGFHGESDTTSTYTLDGFYAIGASGSKTTVLSWEGDQTLNDNEALEFTTTAGTNNLIGDGDNTNGSPNPFNSTNYDNSGIPIVNNTASYGVDLDTYDVSAFISSGESTATTRVESGQDFVILNSVVLKVPSNLAVGTVFEDVNYGGGLGRDRSSSSGVPIVNATVELYDSSANLIQSTTTDASGEYSFGGMINGTYAIRVVNNTVRSTRVGGNSCSSCIPVQTFKTDYAAGVLSPDLNEVGGANPSGSDSNLGVLAGAQSVSTMTIFREGVAGLDFGFNFNTIVNTNEDGQGSLEQFIINSNALGEVGLDIEANVIFDPAAGDDTSIFMIPSASDPLGRVVDANFSSGYFDISISNGNPLSIINGTNTNIDGRTQTAYSGDTNLGDIGAGGASVGVSGNLLPNFELPEIQVHRNNGDVIQVEGNSNTVRNLSIYADNSSAVVISDGAQNTITNSLIGVNALGAKAGDLRRGVEVIGAATRAPIISSNYISGAIWSAILINGGTGAKTINGNHIYAIGDTSCDGAIDVRNGASGVLIQNNLIENSQGYGIKSGGSGNVVIEENTVTGSGQNVRNCSGSQNDIGIRVTASNNQIRNNSIHTNGGAGLAVTGSTITGNLISRNSFYNNGTNTYALGIDLNEDGVTLNDMSDTDNGPNGLLNFPVITTSFQSAGNLIVRGWARPGTTIEWFLTDINEGTAATGDNALGLSMDYGEGQVYIGTTVEGSAADLDSSSRTYSDDDGNTDNTSMFHFIIPLPSGIVAGELITATATLANTTSEFSPFSMIQRPSIITNRRITYRIKR